MIACTELNIFSASDRCVFQKAEYRFGDSICRIDQDGKGSFVTFESGATAYFDIVIIVEGVGSSTRKLLFPGECRMRYMDLTIAFLRGMMRLAGTCAVRKMFSTFYLRDSKKVELPNYDLKI